MPSLNYNSVILIHIVYVYYKEVVAKVFLFYLSHYAVYHISYICCAMGDNIFLIRFLKVKKILMNAYIYSCSTTAIKAFKSQI